MFFIPVNCFSWLGRYSQWFLWDSATVATTPRSKHEVLPAKIPTADAHTPNQRTFPLQHNWAVCLVLCLTFARTWDYKLMHILVRKYSLFFNSYHLTPNHNMKMNSRQSSVVTWIVCAHIKHWAPQDRSELDINIGFHFEWKDIPLVNFIFIFSSSRRGTMSIPIAEKSLLIWRIIRSNGTLEENLSSPSEHPDSANTTESRARLSIFLSGGTQHLE